MQKDCREAVQHFAAAALNDHPRALWELGQAYWNKNSWLARYAQDNHIKKANAAMEHEEIIEDGADESSSAHGDQEAINAPMLVNTSHSRARPSQDTISVKISSSRRNRKTERSMKLPLRPSCKAAVYFLGKLAKMGPWSRALRKGLDQYLQSNAIGSLVSYASAAEMGYSIAQHNYAWLLERLIGGAQSSANASQMANLLGSPLLGMILEAGSANDQSSRYKSLLSVPDFVAQMISLKAATNQSDFQRWLQSPGIRTHIRWRHSQAAQQGDVISLLSSARSLMPAPADQGTADNVTNYHPRLAIKLFEVAMSLGEHEATYELAKMSLYGVVHSTSASSEYPVVVVEKNVTNARVLLEKCANSSTPSAYPALLMLQYTKALAFISPHIPSLPLLLSPEERDIKKAVDNGMFQGVFLFMLFITALKVSMKLMVRMEEAEMEDDYYY